eukprot:2817874-Pleurochrysis_carterae.AAC.1
MADVAVPLRPDRRPPTGAPSPRACDCSHAARLAQACVVPKSRSLRSTRTAHDLAGAAVS